MNKLIVNHNFFEIRIGKRVLKALIDSGSSTSIVSQELLQELNLRSQPLSAHDSTVLFSASNNSLRVVATAEI